MNRAFARQAARLCWLALIAWQVAWLALLPEPLGKQNPALAAFATVPLLLPLRGILKMEDRGLIIGGYLALFAAMFGITELWAAPGERLAAGLQLALCVAYTVVLALATRRRKKR